MPIKGVGSDGIEFRGFRIDLLILYPAVRDPTAFINKYIYIYRLYLFFLNNSRKFNSLFSIFVENNINI